MKLYVCSRRLRASSPDKGSTWSAGCFVEEHVLRSYRSNAVSLLLFSTMKDRLDFARLPRPLPTPVATAAEHACSCPKHSTTVGARCYPVLTDTKMFDRDRCLRPSFRSHKHANGSPRRSRGPLTEEFSQLGRGFEMRYRIEFLECARECVGQAPHRPRCKLWVLRIEVQLVDLGQ